MIHEITKHGCGARFRNGQRISHQLAKCVNDALRTYHDASHAAFQKVRSIDFSSETDEQKVKDALKSAFEKEIKEKTIKDFYRKDRDCRVEARKDLWNASSWDIGLAPIWFSEDGSADDLSANGFAFWSSLAYGFEDFSNVKILKDKSQLLFHVRYHNNEKVLDPGQGNNNFIEQDKLILAMQLRLALVD